MASARDTDPPNPPSTFPHGVENRGDHADGLARLGAEIGQEARHEPSGGYGAALLRVGGRGRRRERAELEALRRAVRRWNGELERLRNGYEEVRASRAEAPAASEREERLGRALAEREAELRALRGAAADRELDLQREHGSEARRQREEISALKQRLEEAESGPDTVRDEELREVKRLAYQRERELRRTQAEKLSETERDAERRISALRAQREADNRSLVERHADEKARRDEELESLGLRRLSEARVYSGRIEELARERAEERTSLEEAVAKLREKHEAERSRLQDRVNSLEEALEEQEAITVGLLGELGYVQRTERPPGLSQSPRLTGELEATDRNEPGARIQEALRELRGIAAPANLLREGLALFNGTEHVKVVGAISKSLGEPEVYASLEAHDGAVGTPVVAFVWPGLGWRRYVSEPRSDTEPQVYLTGYGEDDGRALLPGSVPNARLDGRGLLSLGVRPL